MPAKKTKTKTKPKPEKKEEKVLEGVLVEEPTAEEKIPEIKIVKVLPDYDQLMKFSDVFTKSGLFPGIENIYQAAAVIQLGQEINMGPLQSLRNIFVIPSKRGSTLCIKSEAILALAIQKGVHMEVLEKTNKGCKLRFSRKGQKDHVEEFNEEDAKRAGCLTYDNWLKHPKNMYLWRCVKNGLQSFDARLSLGLTTAEEMQDEGVTDILQPPDAEKPAKAEEEKPQVSFTKTKEQPAPEPPAEPEKEEKPPRPQESDEESKEKKTVVGNIKKRLKAAGADERLFKKFLAEEFQPIKPDRTWIGLKFGNYSFTEGELKDLKLLDDDENMDWTIERYHKSKTFEEEAQKEEPDEEEEEAPF